MRKSKVIMTVGGIIVLIIFALIASSVIDDLSVPGQKYEKNGIKFNYPDTWTEAKSVAEGSIGAVACTSEPATSVVIQQVPSSFGADIYNASEFNKKYLVQSGNYIELDYKNSSINNQSVLMQRYITNEGDGSQKEHVVTWIKMKDNKIYVLLFSTPVEKYEHQRVNYDLIAGTFKLQQDNDDNIINQISSSVQNAINKYINN